MQKATQLHLASASLHLPSRIWSCEGTTHQAMQASLYQSFLPSHILESRFTVHSYHPLYTGSIATELKRGKLMTEHNDAEAGSRSLISLSESRLTEMSDLA